MGKHSIQQAGYSEELCKMKSLQEGEWGKEILQKKRKNFIQDCPPLGERTVHLIMSYFVYFLGVKWDRMTDDLISADGKMSDWVLKIHVPK